MNSNLFVKQMFHYFPAQIAPAVINLIIIMVLTRSFTIEVYGEYILITTLIGFFVTVFTQWLIQSILFYRPKYNEDNRKKEFNLHIESIINKFIIASIILLLLLIIYNTLFMDVTLYILGVLIILVQSIFTIEQVILQSDLQSKRYAMRIFSSSILRVVGIVVLTLTTINLISVLIVIVFSYLLFILPKLKNYMQVKKVRIFQRNNF